MVAVAAGAAGLSNETDLELSGAADRIRMALSDERDALASLGDDRSVAAAARLAAPQPAPTVASLSTASLDVEALNAEDAKAQAVAAEASDEMMSELLLGDAAGVIDLANIDRIPREGDGPQWRCLALAIYFEARGESTAGQVAVAEVILNRVDSSAYPDTICDVVRQGETRLHGCQFSFMCDGKPETVTERDAWRKAGKIAYLMLQGRPRVLTSAATHFHTTAVNPFWAKRLVRTIKIDDHIFYRKPTQLASN